MKEWRISDLIPQRPPIVMVDELCSASAEDATTYFLFTEENMFCHNNHISEAGIIEHIAQSAAAMSGYNYKVAGKAVPVGFIGEVKKFTLHFFPQIGEQLNTQIKIVSQAMGISLISASTFVNGKIAATCQMKIFVRES